MPRPPTLPIVDWKAIYQSGKQYTEWLQEGDSKENCDKIETNRKEFVLEAKFRGYLSAIRQKVHVIAIAEDWCGDVIRHVPVLQKVAENTSNLNVKYITRQDYPDVFIRFLTNGGEAIPKFIFLNHEFVECGNWGPMPAGCRELIARGKACGDVKSAREKVAALYEIDKQCRIVIEELFHLIDVANTTAI